MKGLFRDKCTSRFTAPTAAAAPTAPTAAAAGGRPSSSNRLGGDVLVAGSWGAGCVRVVDREEASARFSARRQPAPPGRAREARKSTARVHAKLFRKSTLRPPVSASFQQGWDAALVC